MNHNTAETDRCLEVFLLPVPNSIFYPGTSKPLKITHPRYVKMIDDAIASQTLVALAFSEHGFAEDVGFHQVRPVAGVGRPLVLDRGPDGSLLVLFRGVGKVRLESCIANDQPYLTCRGVWLPDGNEIRPENLCLFQDLVRQLEGWLRTQVSSAAPNGAILSPHLNPNEKINYLCALMIRDVEAQQRLLEIQDLNEKIEVASLLITDTQQQH